MIPEFIGRERELEFLERAHAKKGFKLIVLYGRRRVGKTELLKKFLHGKEGAYILFTDESLDENLKELKEKFATLTGKELFRELDTHSLYDLFKYFASEASDRKLAIAIDEFPYLLGLNKGLLSTFQKIADELLAKSNITLILCGSSLSVMENDVLGYRQAHAAVEAAALRLCDCPEDTARYGRGYESAVRIWQHTLLPWVLRPWFGPAPKY